MVESRFYCSFMLDELTKHATRGLYSCVFMFNIGRLCLMFLRVLNSFRCLVYVLFTFVALW